MTSHITTSHGADFFGADTYPIKELRDLAAHLPWALPADENHQPLTELLESAGDTELHIEPAQAALLAALLHRTAASKRLNKKHAETAARLSLAAASSATASQPWTWTPTGKDHAEVRA